MQGMTTFIQHFQFASVKIFCQFNSVLRSELRCFRLMDSIKPEELFLWEEQVKRYFCNDFFLS